VQELQRDFHVNVVRDICFENGYEIPETYDCFFSTQVEEFAKIVLERMRALDMPAFEKIPDLRVSHYWAFCINSDSLAEVRDKDGTLIAYQIQACNFDITMHALRYGQFQ
jgi:hypothetical protein